MMDRDRELHEMADEGRALMRDYIKREDAIDAVADQMAFEASMETGDDYMRADYSDDAKEWLSGCPSADVAPVRHGHWVDVDRMQMHDLHGVLTWGNSFMCTECNFKTFAVEGHMSQYHYCPNCGAKMDGEEKNCDTCKHYDKGWDDIVCDGCTKAYSNWERKDDE